MTLWAIHFCWTSGLPVCMFPAGQKVHGCPASEVPGMGADEVVAGGWWPWWRGLEGGQIRSVRRQAVEKVSILGEQLAGRN